MGRRLFLSLVFIMCTHLAYAQGLAKQEAVAYFNEGVELQRDGDFEGAITAYQKVLLLAPENRQFQKYISNNSGVMHAYQGNFKLAEQAFKEALSIDPHYKPASLNLGLIYDKYGDRLRALEYWAQALNLEAMKPKTFIMEDEQPIAEE